jgi:hypothetical protein
MGDAAGADQLKVTFFGAEVDESFPVVDHVFTADGALGFS